MALRLLRAPMPIYEYRCQNGHTFEVIQSMSDDPVETCEVCGAPVERVFHPSRSTSRDRASTPRTTPRRSARVREAPPRVRATAERRAAAMERAVTAAEAEAPPRPTPARRRPTRARRAARRSAALALVALGLLPASAGAVADHARFTGQVTDALRTPTHRLAAGASGRAVADLVFVDAQQAHTTVRSCVRRRDVRSVRTCFSVTTGAAGSATVTPLRFPIGRYVARWWVNGRVVARWRFVVVAAD